MNEFLMVPGFKKSVKIFWGQLENFEFGLNIR